MVISPIAVTLTVSQKEPAMIKQAIFRDSLAGMIFALSATASAQDRARLREKNYNYSEWARAASRGRHRTFSGPADDLPRRRRRRGENGKPGDIRAKDDFVAQCKYAYDKSSWALERTVPASATS